MLGLASWYMDLLSMASSYIKAEWSRRRLEDHPRIFTQRIICGLLLEKHSESSQLFGDTGTLWLCHLHYLQVGLTKVTDLLSCLLAPRGASWYTHSTCKTWWPVLPLQLKVWRVSEPPPPIHKKAQGASWGIILATHQWHSHGCSVSAGQWAAIYLPNGAGLSHDSYLPYSPAT